MKTNYNKERGQVIRELNDKLIFLTQALRGAEIEGDTKEYRALLKSYMDAAKLQLSLVSEEQSENAGAVDALTDFNKPSVYDTRGLLVI
ncbi:MAG: hypothetical protein LBO63_05510 [Oscillospiraceae bacterium]|jgi:hypothetical protein|nr:hypothetical protein [Oscillospiraceae bacterium]